MMGNMQIERAILTQQLALTGLDSHQSNETAQSYEMKLMASFWLHYMLVAGACECHTGTTAPYLITYGNIVHQ